MTDYSPCWNGVRRIQSRGGNRVELNVYSILAIVKTVR